jgi:hypothetical protein
VKGTTEPQDLPETSRRYPGRSDVVAGEVFGLKFAIGERVIDSGAIGVVDKGELGWVSKEKAGGGIRGRYDGDDCRYL